MTLYLYYMFICPWTIHRIGLHVFKLYIDGIIKWSEVTQSCPTLCDPVDCSLPGSPVHGIFQARELEWVAVSFSRGSSRPRDWTRVSRFVGRRFTIWAWQVYKTSVLFSACCSFSVVFAWFIHVDMCGSSWSLSLLKLLLFEDLTMHLLSPVNRRRFSS